MLNPLAEAPLIHAAEMGRSPWQLLRHIAGLSAIVAFAEQLVAVYPEAEVMIVE